MSKLLSNLSKAFILSLAIGATGCSSFGEKMFVEKESPLNFIETTQKIESNIKNKNWEISKKFDFQKSMIEKKGVDLGPIVSYKICNADYAYELLKNEDHRYISTMMPCSISVYTKKNKTYVAYMNLSFMKNFFNSEIKEIMFKVDGEMATITDVGQ